MKVGSLVECVKNALGLSDVYGEVGIAISKGDIFTVRDIVFNDCGIYLEEITNPINPDSGNEFAYRIEWFQELLPPMQAEIKELLEEPLFVCP